jgi:uncharacterized protein with GYD domain
VDTPHASRRALRALLEDEANRDAAAPKAQGATGATGTERVKTEAFTLKREVIMATYVVLANFTDQGIRNVKDSPKRAQAVKDMAKKAKATIKEMYWTLGQYDLVAIVEGADDAAMTALGLSIGAQGNVRTQTLRAFDEAEIKAIIGKMV